jgi:hypothetical protein
VAVAGITLLMLVAMLNMPIFVGAALVTYLVMAITVYLLKRTS